MLGKQILHYEILEKLGEGGMGIVYKAMDTRLSRHVAIKFLPRQIASVSEERDRFKIEARAAAALSHPNISTIHAIEEVDDEVFIVMEFIDGAELKQKVDSGSMALGQALDFAKEIADGLHAAHEKGIVHRDIKSANIMVTESGMVKIMDFGLAKVKGSGLVTSKGTTLGTAAYMSPEQTQGHDVDHRADIWSLGVVLYEMLTGELPFKAGYEAAWAYAIVNEHPLSPSDLDRKIPVSVDSIVMKALEKESDLRWQSAHDFREALVQARREMETTEQTVKKKAIVVVPFNNISPDADSDYFSDGLTEELIMNLSRLQDMRVVSRTTSMQYKGTSKDVRTIGRELGVRYIVEGSVRKFQDKLRITAQLIDVQNDSQLWAESFKGTIEDVFDIQEQVSKQIVDALMLKLTPTEKVVLEKRSTTDAEAFDCNLRARDFLYRLTKNNIHYAIQLFKRAIGLDPRYADAHAGLGEAYAQLYAFHARQVEWRDLAVESSLKALMYDSNSSEAYAALGTAYLYDKETHEEAVMAGKKAIELDPDNFIGYWVLGRIYHSTDRFEEAADLFNKVITLNPDFYTAYMDLRMAYEKLGDMARTEETLNRALEVFDRYLAQHPDDARARMIHAQNLVQVDRTDDAREEAAKAMDLNPTDPLVLYNAACFYSRIMEVEKAVAALNGAVSGGFQDLEWMKNDPDLENIRQEPGYLEVAAGRGG
ncbi:MAG: protein kinase [Rhodothermales bacterium]|nr:protein kinase [Rhodothermales bacterium]